MSYLVPIFIYKRFRFLNSTPSFSNKSPINGGNVAVKIANFLLNSSHVKDLTPDMQLNPVSTFESHQ